MLRRSDALNGPLGARKKKNSRSRLESSILRPMQKTPTAGGGGLKGSKKNAKVTKKVWNMRLMSSPRLIFSCEMRMFADVGNSSSSTLPSP